MKKVSFRLKEIKRREGFSYAIYSSWSGCECSSVVHSLLLNDAQDGEEQAIEQITKELEVQYEKVSVRR